MANNAAVDSEYGLATRWDSNVVGQFGQPLLVASQMDDLVHPARLTVTQPRRRGDVTCLAEKRISLVQTPAQK